MEALLSETAWGLGAPGEAAERLTPRESPAGVAPRAMQVTRAGKASTPSGNQQAEAFPPVIPLVPSTDKSCHTPSKGKQVQRPRSILAEQQAELELSQ